MSKLKTLAAAAALLVGGVSTTSLAQDATFSPADINKDGFVTEREQSNHDARMAPTVVVIEQPALIVRPADTTTVDPMDGNHARPFTGDMWGEPGRSPNPDPAEIGGN